MTRIFTLIVICLGQHINSQNDIENTKQLSFGFSISNGGGDIKMKDLDKMYSFGRGLEIQATKNIMEGISFSSGLTLLRMQNTFAQQQMFNNVDVLSYAIPLMCKLEYSLIKSDKSLKLIVDLGVYVSFNNAKSLLIEKQISGFNYGNMINLGFKYQPKDYFSLYVSLNTRNDFAYITGDIVSYKFSDIYLLNLGFSINANKMFK